MQTSSNVAFTTTPWTQETLIDALGDDTVVRARRFINCVMKEREGRLVLSYGSRELRLPKALGETVGLLLGGSKVQLSSLPDMIDRDAKVHLVRKLIQEGVLEVV